MDKLQFYPTPYELAEMVGGMISKRKGALLEPSAGHGDLLAGLSITAQFHIDCIEIDPDNCAVLKSKKEEFHISNIVQGDFLQIPVQKIYDVVIMNPPFRNGVTHVLRAWNVLKQGGEMAAILNAETLKNDNSTDRQLLLNLIQRHGRSTFIGKGFVEAERQADVECVLIYLNKPNAYEEYDFTVGINNKDNDAPAYRQTADDTAAGNGLIPRDFVANAAEDYKRGLEYMFSALDQFYKGYTILEARFGRAFNREESKNRNLTDAITGAVRSLCSAQNLPTTKDSLVGSVRALAWISVLDKTEAEKLLYSTDRDKFVSDVLSGASAMPFTEENIKAFLRGIWERRDGLFTNAVVKLFDELRRYHKGNTVQREGWKTNKSWKVPEKIIYPRGVEYSFNHFSISCYRDFIDDLDRIIRILDCKNEDFGTGIKTALRESFKDKSGIAETEYFSMRYYMKGTLHITFKRIDLLDRINVIGTGGRNDLPNMEK